MKTQLIIRNKKDDLINADIMAMNDDISMLCDILKKIIC